MVNKLLNKFLLQDGVIAAALIGTDGLIIDKTSECYIDMERFSALLGIYFSNSTKPDNTVHLLQLPEHEDADYVLLAYVSGALLAIFSSNQNNAKQLYANVNKDIRHLTCAIHTIV